MALPHLIAHRAVRAFQDTPVPTSLVEQVIDTARWTGSARNRQPWRFVAVADADTKQLLSRFGAYASHLADAPLVLVVLSPTERGLDTEFDVGRVVQSVVLVATEAGLGCGVVSLYPDEHSRAAADLVDAGAEWSARHAIALGWPGPPPKGGTLAVPAGRLPLAELLSFR
ncbi:nitroreductase family protein [Nocardioides alcanivorans]|uniref:nitroreductase family protein n=1 Tax=Nocardioides alcanivorans TaxID=2897352 RepID=UPI001F328154|nr:nitroreductase family protein [Nocardioides alcanivorans]